MKLLATFALIAIILCAGSVYCHATPLPLDGSWTTLLEYMNEGDFFTDGPYTWTSSQTVRFTITDYMVVSDRFEVYDLGTLVAETPWVPDWDELGVGKGDSPPYTDDPDLAFADGSFSAMVIDFAPGIHEIEIRNIHLPHETVMGTVAFKAVEIPEPCTIVFAAIGGLAVLKRRRRTRQ
jgi:hypothetical protein